MINQTLSYSTPIDIPKDKQQTYKDNLNQATVKMGRIMLFALDQKNEHPN
jgi:hypothetical protein